MKRNFLIAIDGGTTNTRVRLVRLSDLSIVAKISETIGAKDTIFKGKEALKNVLLNSISRILKENNLSKEDIIGVAASGMITSEAGLLEVPHVIAPAGLEEIASHVVERSFEEIWPEPILFIPGIKTLSFQRGTSPFEYINSCDIMRGEECETLGIAELENIKEPSIMVLPGSHTKFVFLDEKRRISGSLTTLAGELANAILSSTLIGRSLESLSLTQLDEKFLLNGFKLSCLYGLTRSLFLIRLLHLLSESTPDQRRSFLWGALFGTDLMALKKDERFNSLLKDKKGQINIIVGGTSPLREIFGKLLREWAKENFPELQVRVLSSEVAEKASAIGATLIALRRLNLN